MLIGFDGTEANTLPRVGSGKYGYEILRHLLPLGENVQVYLPTSYQDDMPTPSSILSYRVVKPPFLWTQWVLPINLFLHSPKPNVFFTPTHYAPRFSPVPTVVTIFDLSFLKPEFQSFFKVKDLWQLKLWTSYSIHQAAHILTISEHSKKDLITEYDVDASHITVTPLGSDPIFNYPKEWHTKDEVRTAYALPERYLLFVGTLQPRKNLGRFIEAYAALKNRHKDLKLVIAGKKGWFFEKIFAKVKHLHLLDDIRFLDYIPEKDLPILMQLAEVFVLPSLYEGFGIPILNAFAAGTPVVASNISSLPEVVGDAGVLIDPYSVESMEHGIEKAMKEADNLRAEGKRRIKLFSWEICANKTISVLREAAHG